MFSRLHRLHEPLRLGVLDTYDRLCLYGSTLISCLADLQSDVYYDLGEGVSSLPGSLVGQH